ncbi:MAG: PAS domain S-box protein, partial [Anaerolineaceae bacterium]|nr:PAS domain S-box protein [Anaerolineaceae bacterium]
MKIRKRNVQKAGKPQLPLEDSNHLDHILVSEYYQADDALKVSQEILQHLFESDPDANILVNGDGKIISINQQAEADFGYCREELEGKAIEVLLPPRKRSRHIDLRESYLKNPKKQFMGSREEIVGRRKNGEEFPLEVTLNPLKMEKGVLILAVARDITQRKEMEREIAEVQHRLIESTESERLRLAQELHDGPMQDLYGVTYLLGSIESELPDPQTREEMASARQAVNQVINTLREVCSTLRPTALLPFGLNRAITSHAERYREIYPNLAIHLELAKDGVRLPEATRLALYRIYQNLVSNVVRHAHATQVWIRFLSDAEQVVLEVEDDGVGFIFPHRYVE